MIQIGAATRTGAGTRLLRLFTLILLGLIVMEGSSAQQPPKRSAPKFWIVFERVSTPALSYDTFPYVDIFIMDEDGHQLRRLTTDHRSHNPAWSPDGQQIAFLRNERKPVALNSSDEGYDAFMAYRDYLTISRGVLRMDADGKNASRIASLGPDAADVTWFPDGNRLGVRMFDRDAMRALVDTSGRFLPRGESTVALRDFLRTGQPSINGYSWSDDDLLVWVPPVDNFSPTLVASTSNRFSADNNYPEFLPSPANLRASLRVVSLDGAFLPFSILAYDIAWSHDGKHIAYSAFSGDQKSVLYLSEALDGDVETNRRPLTDQGLDAHGPSWSADDSLISFTALWKNSSQIFIENADGSKLLQLSRDPKLSCYHVSWSPDGKWIVADCRKNVSVMRPLTEEFGALSSIYLFDVGKPGRKPRQLTSCALSSPLPSPTCGARNPSFAPRVSDKASN